MARCSEGEATRLEPRGGSEGEVELTFASLFSRFSFSPPPLVLLKARSPQPLFQPRRTSNNHPSLLNRPSKSLKYHHNLSNGSGTSLLFSLSFFRPGTSADSFTFRRRCLSNYPQLTYGPPGGAPAAPTTQTTNSLLPPVGYPPPLPPQLVWNGQSWQYAS